ncbi:MAG: hypothetical protein LAO03_07330 [Acidobacteriia bacterium]|nr:hypothetical protein [Terriglobia bacterium]
MNHHKHSNVDYGRKLLDSGLEGARSGRESFLHGRSLTPFLSESVRHALKPAAIGVCLGLLSARPGRRHNSASRALAYGFFGGVLGFGAAVAWKSRFLSASVVSSALKNIDKVRDEHWLERHPIDYA